MTPAPGTVPSLRVAVDFGTSSTAAVVSLRGGPPQVVVVDGAPLVPSAVYAAPDGTVFVGQEAERQAAIDPARYEPNPKRRIDEGELLLGDTVLAVADVVRAVLARVLTEAGRPAGGAARCSTRPCPDTAAQLPAPRPRRCRDRRTRAAGGDQKSSSTSGSRPPSPSAR